MKALIFCKINHQEMTNVIEQFNKIPEIKKIFSLTGDYDILAEIKVKDSEALFNSFSKKIDKVSGIIKTNTHVVMKEFVK